MAKKTNSIDGFVPRRSRSQIGNVNTKQETTIGTASPDRNLHENSIDKSEHTAASISRAEIDSSLESIDTPPEGKKRRRRSPEERARRRKRIRRIIVLILAIGLIYVGYVGVRAMMSSGNIFKGSPFDLIQHTSLKMDSNGRSNVLILGTSEDDPGHEGGYLTDSIMVMSIDQNKKNAYMISIPRDLFVKYGQACNAGYAGKINEYYNCVHDGEEGVDADRKALAKAAGFFGNIVGLDIQYGVNVNYTVMRDVINAVGGKITVNIEGNGPVPAGIEPGSVMDSNFDWKCGVGDRKVSRAEVLRRCPPRGHFIDYGPGPVELDAEHALYLAQARGDAAPTWGLAQSNFDREKNQQKILKAIRDKAANGGLLANIGNVTNVLDSIGNNLRTTFEAKEVRTLVDLAKEINNDEIKSISLIDGDEPVMTTGMVSGMSVVEPSAGTYDYSQLQAVIARNLSSNPVTREDAQVQVVNASGTAGVAQAQTDKLGKDGFALGEPMNTTGTYPAFAVYQIGTGNPATAAKLKELYKVEISHDDLPFTVARDTKFVVIIGRSSTSGVSGAAN